ncbi:MAG TPA: CDP-alcohol phosphatidyltransferase family protein, partial [Kofleriaceae bacterium]|nr:CDP-alcohol phosphatidyltransferase family protein [Kofleriaceae bacterium]
IAGFMVWLMTPVERMLLGRVSPNAVTAVSLAMCIITGVAAGMGALAAAMWLYTFGGVLDILDGRLARLSGKQTAAGALFDSVSDRWGELFVFGGYAWYLRDTPWLLAAFGAFGASMMVSYTRARAESLGIELSAGMMQRAERIVVVVFGTLGALLYGDVEAAVPIIGITMLICAATSAATAINRWIIAFRELSKRTAPVVVEEAPAMSLPVVASIAPAELRKSAPELRKVRPLEQH